MRSVFKTGVYSPVKLGNLIIFSRISQKRMYEKNNFCYPVTLAWFSIQILLNFEIFKLSVNLSLTHLRAHTACYKFKRRFEPCNAKEIFHDSFENFEFTRIIQA